MKLRAYLLSLIAAVMIFTGSGTGRANAEAQIYAGQLTCKGGVGFGLLVISSKPFDCRFVPANGAHSQRYRARVTNLGVDIGITGPSVLVWTVFASSDRFDPDLLAGQYLGVGAEASVGVGAGAKLLIGGFKNSFALQPLSVQGQTGVNIAYGIAGLRLRAR